LFFVFVFRIVMTEFYYSLNITAQNIVHTEEPHHGHRLLEVALALETFYPPYPPTDPFGRVMKPY